MYVTRYLKPIEAFAPTLGDRDLASAANSPVEQLLCLCKCLVLQAKAMLVEIEDFNERCYKFELTAKRCSQTANLVTYTTSSTRTKFWKMRKFRRWISSFAWVPQSHRKCCEEAKGFPNLPWHCTVVRCGAAWSDDYQISLHFWAQSAKCGSSFSAVAINP